MKLSIIGETAVILGILDFIIWLSSKNIFLFYIWIILVLLLIIDYMKGGITDKKIIFE